MQDTIGRLVLANPTSKDVALLASFASTLHPGGCCTAAGSGSAEVWCGFPRTGYVRSTADLGCAFRRSIILSSLAGSNAGVSSERLCVQR